MNIGDFIQGIRIGLLITHRQGGRLDAWTVRVMPERRAAWREGWSRGGESLPPNTRFQVDREPSLVRQVTDCPRVSVVFQDRHRYCFLSGLARMAGDPAGTVLQMEILTADLRELAAAELWELSLDVSQRA
jgi:hypothetical protein